MGMGFSWGDGSLPVFALDMDLGCSMILREVFKRVPKQGAKRTPLCCLWFIVLGHIQALNPDHHKTAKRRLLIHRELIASIEIKSMWRIKDYLHVVTPSVEYAAEYRLCLRKHNMCVEGF